LQFLPGQGRASVGLDGSETFDVVGLSDALTPGQRVTVRAQRANGETIEFEATVRIDSPIEVEYYQHGGVLQYVLRQLLQS
jgi:aconitate hydratase